MCDCILCRFRAFELKLAEDRKTRPTAEREAAYIEELNGLLADFDRHLGPIEHNGILLQIRLAIVLTIDSFQSCLDYFLAESEANKNQFAA